MINLAMMYLGIGYGMKIKLMEYYNDNIFKLIDSKRRYRIQPNDNWCAMFCSVIAHRTNAIDFPYEVSVYYMVKKAKSLGCFSKDLSKAKPNDLIIYDWKDNGTLDHVGILVYMKPDHIMVIEGNYSGTVKKRVVKLNSKEIYGVIHVTTHIDVDIEQLARDSIKGVYGTGEQRKLTLGVNYDVVQKRINEILK